MTEFFLQNLFPEAGETWEQMSSYIMVDAVMGVLISAMVGVVSGYVLYLCIKEFQNVDGPPRFLDEVVIPVAFCLSIPFSVIATIQFFSKVTLLVQLYVAPKATVFMYFVEAWGS